jgi:hypothetical protein
VAPQRVAPSPRPGKMYTESKKSFKVRNKLHSLN